MISTVSEMSSPRKLYVFYGHYSPLPVCASLIQDRRKASSLMSVQVPPDAPCDPTTGILVSTPVYALHGAHAREILPALFVLVGEGIRDSLSPLASCQHLSSSWFHPSSRLPKPSDSAETSASCQFTTPSPQKFKVLILILFSEAGLVVIPFECGDPLDV